ncbi:MAG: hypothetical protein DMH00_08230, partial [Acidobacteria bacterium]
LASGEYGIDASGNWAGGHFSNPTGDSIALLAAFGVRGVEGFGSDAGGYFQDNLASPTATALAGSPGYGIKGYGNSAGGYF